MSLLNAWAMWASEHPWRNLGFVVLPMIAAAFWFEGTM